MNAYQLLLERYRIARDGLAKADRNFDNARNPSESADAHERLEIARTDFMAACDDAHLCPQEYVQLVRFRRNHDQDR